MANRKAFLAAIRENPEDDTPRLVYADWLDDNGDRDRAEFIRVQIELARLREDDVRAFDLRWRQDELLNQNGDIWREEVPAWAREDCSFRRGFVDGVRSNILKFIRSGKGLSRTVPVRAASLSAAPDRVTELASCPHLAQLTSLAFYYVHRTGPGITDAGAAVLADSEYLSGLQRLGLTNCLIHDGGARALASSGYLGALTSLDLRGNYVGGAGVVALLEKLPQLTSLQVTTSSGAREAYLDGEGLRRLFSSTGMARLERLTVDTEGINDSACQPSSLLVPIIFAA